MSAPVGSRWARFARGVVEGACVAAVAWLAHRGLAESQIAVGDGLLCVGAVALLCGLSRGVTGGVVGGLAGLALGGLLGVEVVGRQAPNFRGGREHIVGQPARIAGPTLSGGTYDISLFKGKVVIVDFWATWCAPCLQELPELVQLYNDYHAEGLEVVGISHDLDAERLERFVREKKIPWPQVIFPIDQSTMRRPNPNARAYGVDGIPYSLVVDREGTIVAERAHGDALRRAVEKALRDQGPTSSDFSRRGTLLLFALLGWLAGAALEWSMRQPAARPATS